MPPRPQREQSGRRSGRAARCGVDPERKVATAVREARAARARRAGLVPYVTVRCPYRGCLDVRTLATRARAEGVVRYHVCRGCHRSFRSLDAEPIAGAAPVAANARPRAAQNARDRGVVLVDYSQVRCPLAGCRDVRVVKTRRTDLGRIRFHECRTCHRPFRSLETMAGGDHQLPPPAKLATQRDDDCGCRFHSIQLRDR